MGLAHVLLPELLELLLERLAGDLLVAAVGRVPHVHQGALGGDSIAKYWSGGIWCRGSHQKLKPKF